MSFNVICENKILAKISEFTVAILKTVWVIRIDTGVGCFSSTR